MNDKKKTDKIRTRKKRDEAQTQKFRTHFGVYSIYDIYVLHSVCAGQIIIITWHIVYTPHPIIHAYLILSFFIHATFVSNFNVCLSNSLSLFLSRDYLSTTFQLYSSLLNFNSILPGIIRRIQPSCPLKNPSPWFNDVTIFSFSFS